MNGKDFTFHCFRKMFLSASINSGIGLTAGKKLCGKSVAESDDTYLTGLRLKEKFVQLKKFLSITETAKVEAQTIEVLKNAISQLQTDLTTQKAITATISGDNAKLKKQVDEITRRMNAYFERAAALSTWADNLGQSGFLPTEHLLQKPQPEQKKENEPKTKSHKYQVKTKEDQETFSDR